MVRQYICVRLSPDVYSSQGSVAMRLRCGEIFTIKDKFEGERSLKIGQQQE